MANTRSTNEAIRGTREIAEAQHERYKALAENFEASRRHALKLAEDGSEFLKLQERTTEVAQEWWNSSLKLLSFQQRSVGSAQNWWSDAVGAWQEQAENNRRTAKVFANSAQKQQEGFRKLTEGWAGAYQNFFSSFGFSPVGYFQEGLRSVEAATRQGLEASQQITRNGLRVTEQTERVIEQAEEITHEVELRAAVQGALKTEDYDKLNVDQVSRKLDALTVSELEQVHEYEKRSHNRETLVKQIEQKISAKS